jgi:hypothetical protein
MSSPVILFSELPDEISVIIHNYKQCQITRNKFKSVLDFIKNPKYHNSVRLTNNNHYALYCTKFYLNEIGMWKSRFVKQGFYHMYMNDKRQTGWCPHEQCFYYRSHEHKNYVHMDKYINNLYLNIEFDSDDEQERANYVNPIFEVMYNGRLISNYSDGLYIGTQHLTDAEFIALSLS